MYRFFIKILILNVKLTIYKVKVAILQIKIRVFLIKAPLAHLRNRDVVGVTALR